MSDRKPTQFEWERHVYHDEIMAAIEQRGEWVLAQIRRRFRTSLSLVGVAALWLIAWVLLAGPGGLPALLVPVWVLCVLGAFLMARVNPTKLRRQWNEDHPHMGQYLAPDLTD